MEIKKVQPKSADSMEILEFVKLDEVDPLYFDSSHYLVPEEAGRKAYHLLVETMGRAGYAAAAKLAGQLIESLAAPFKPAKYADQYQTRLKELIEAKRSGEETTATEGPKLAPVIDLMDALQKSFASQPQKAPKKKGPARATASQAGAAPAKKDSPARERARKAG